MREKGLLNGVRAAALCVLVGALATGDAGAAGLQGLSPRNAERAADRVLDEIIADLEDVERRIPDRKVVRCDLRAVAERGASGCEALLGRVGAEYATLARRLTTIDGSALPNGRTLDLEVLAWHLETSAVRYLDPDAGYEDQLYRHTSRRLDPSELHQIGLQEVERVGQAMQDFLHEQDPEADLRAFLDAARTDGRLFAGSREELLAAARVVAARINAALPRVVAGPLTRPYGVEAPRGMRGSFMAQYGGSDGGQAGLVMLNPDPRQVPLYMLEALMLHEGVPGHHWQMTRARESVPAWRREHTVTALVEGWGLYAESLGDEMEILWHPLTEFGRLNLEMWRAIRLVVDTGFHTLDWTDDEAEEFFLEHTSLPRQQLAVEIERYRRAPGQAVAYKVGEMELSRLRADAERELGAGFELREFHRVALQHGAVPLDALARIVGEWIEQRRAES